MLKREFSIAKYPDYNNEVDRLLVQSTIFNGGSEIRPSGQTIFWNKQNTLDELYRIAGDEKGVYSRDNIAHPCLIVQVQRELDKLQDEFENYKNERVLQGHEEPKNLPGQMMLKFYHLKAQMTVLEAEADELRKRLKSIDEPRNREEDAKVLQYGLQGAGKLKDGILVKIDFQTVEISDGSAIISDKRSPYSGMLVTDYRKLCGEWQQEQKKKADEAFKLLQESYKEQGLPVPQQAPIRAPKLVSRASLPPFPAWAKRYEI